MPSTRIKNAAYRALLPLLAPRLEKDPIISCSGHPLNSRASFIRLLRRHHVTGSAYFASTGDLECLVLSRSLKTGQAPAEDTMFRVASITKTATALVALRLAEEGILDLDRPVAAILPDSHHLLDLKDVTTRHLLSHSSGLADPPSLEKLLETGEPFHTAVNGARFAPPGESFRYSNLGFGLIGCVLEALTGRPVSRLYCDVLFQPLGMNATLEGCSLRESEIMPVIRVLPCRPEQMVRVTRLGKVPLTEADPLRHYGHTAGSMYTDIRSLATMISCIRDGGAPLLQPSSIREMTAVHAVYGAVSPTLSYGLGLLIIRDLSLSPGRILGHQGFAYGCADGAFWDEETGDMMIMLNGGCSEARSGRLGLCNRDLLRYTFRKELPLWD